VRRVTEVAVGDEIQELRRVVTREDVSAYAEASGDRNPLHLDDAFARSVGFPGVIAHGMFTMGHMTAAVVAWAGEPSAVVSVSAQFRAPVFPDDTIVAGGRVRAIDHDDDVAELDTWVVVQRDGREEWPVKRGAARVRLTRVD
jgi:acyl dehydratase